ncbi:1-phosphatidylinositol-4-phosphate 5-kinase [Coprinopsis cinerea AmutBmut pab1-1]|nr:1-phosphatidylinositol-4-phosphate 5-kinase [Coprinopsis cinerea AmutBmut pab1-1]
MEGQACFSGSAWTELAVVDHQNPMAAAAIALPQRRSPSPLTVPSPHRQSIVPTSPSSAASFKTAAASPTSSVHTITSPTTKDGEAIFTAISAGSTADVHVVTVTRDDTVDIVDASHTHQKSISGCLRRPSIDTSPTHVGPPPPSPPASVEETGVTESTTSQTISKPRNGSVSTVTEGSGNQQQPRRPSSPSSTTPQVNRPTITSSPLSMAEPLPFMAGQSSKAALLQPAPPPPSSFSQSQRPTRRNTTGSSAASRTKRFTGPHSKGHSFAYDDASYPDPATTIEGELASDIEHHADQIRRERMSKRFKQQQKEAEEALTRQTSKGSKGDKDDVDRPLVGNLIGEGHVNYVLMYNMLTGIRIAVSRCQAKIKRPLTDQDFAARHKYSFDIVGNELTPSAKYDFKFKDYAPWVFRTLREDHFALDPADYLLSLTAKYILSELGSPGKSGSFFYFSRDYRFIIKTIRHSEAKFLLKILKQYYDHVQENPHTLLSRFYGLHRVKLPHGRKIHFVIMNNLFPPHKDIHETFDLKGSTVGREYPEDKAAQNPRAVLKDMNWINRGKTLDFGPEKQAFLIEQIRRDSEFLKEISVMDYSLLVGIHNMQRGNKDNVRKNTLKVFSPDLPASQRSKSSQTKGGAKSPEAIAMRRIMRSSDPKSLGFDSSIHLPEKDSGEKHAFLFYQDEGGMRATDENNEPLPMIYYLGIIDILTPYSMVKKAENIWKGLKDDRHKISPVPPPEYAERFFAFMKAIMRGGEGGAKFV